jgi:HlyD family secretion protein
MRVFAIILILLAILATFFYFFSLRHPQEQNHIILFGNVDVRQVDLGFRVSGRVENMVFEEGDFVPKGAQMAHLETQPYEDLVREAQASIESFKSSLINADQILKRRQALVGDEAVSREDFQNAQSTYDISSANLKQAEASLGVALTNIHDTRMFCPNDGTILTRIREPGTVVRETDPIYTLSLISPIWIRAFVSEPQLGLIYPGMPAEVFTDVENGPSYQGHIGFISPVAEFTPKTVETTQLRTDLVYRLRITVDNPDRLLKQGMPVTVKLPLQPREARERDSS